MKRYAICIVFLFLCLSCYEKKDIKTISDDSYKMYYLIFDNKGLNTSNFYDYFNDDTVIIGIYPYISSLDKLKIKDNLYYEFSSNKNNIDDFINYYVSSFEKYNYKNKTIGIKINGINIDKVKVYTSYNDIYNFLQKYDVKYVNTLNNY